MRINVTIFSLLAAGAFSMAFGADDAAAPGGGVYKPKPFSDYEVILERMPFGPLPVGVNPDGTPDAAAGPQTPQEVAVEQQQLAKQVKISCINISPDGETIVGFTDISVNPGKNYYIANGDEVDGWKVTDADYDDEWAKIEKDGVEITVQLGVGLVDSSVAEKSRRPSEGAAAAVTDAKSEEGDAMQGGRRRHGMGMSRMGGMRGGFGGGLFPRGGGLGRPAAPVADRANGSEEGGSSGGSYIDRLRERAERRRRQSEQEQAKQRQNEDQLKKMAEKIANLEKEREEREERENEAPPPEEPQQ